MKPSHTSSSHENLVIIDPVVSEITVFPAKFFKGGRENFSKVGLRLDFTPNLCADVVSIR